jgi:MFS family permease
VERLGLACAEKEKIGMMGSVLMMGWAISSLFTNRLADILGRKKVFLASMALQVPAMLIIILSQNYNLTVFAFFLFGLCAAGRVSVGFLLMIELMPAAKTRFV